MDQKILKEMIDKKVGPISLQYADLQGTDLHGINLQGADLWGANLRGADLRGADLQHADLRVADLQSANLQGADLRNANLQGADLRYANLQGANLQNADLRYGAEIDFSVWPLCCGSKNIKVDLCIIRLLLAHVACLECEAPEFEKIKEAILPYAIGSHRAKDLGLDIH